MVRRTHLRAVYYTVFSIPLLPRPSLPIIFLNALFSVTLSLCFCVSVNDQVYVHLCTRVNLIQKNLDVVRMYFATSVF
jgi:formate-dependent nitrite reductase membrane component NrfD